IAKLNAAVVDGLSDPALRQRLADLGQQIVPREQQTPEALAAFHKAEIEKWWPIIKAPNIKRNYLSLPTFPNVNPMKPPRRNFLFSPAGAARLLASPCSAWAQAYPANPVSLIVTFPAGSGPDIIGRLAGQWLSERLGQQFVIENKPGFGGNIGTEYVVNSAADGYTIVMPVSTNAVNATLYPNLSFNFMRDIAPIRGIGKTPFVVVVPPSFPAKTLPEFIAYAKANPGKINMASGGIGSSPHVCGELLQIMTGIKLVHVPYRSNYMPDLLAGQVQVVFNPIAQALPVIRDGKLRALAVTPAKRSAALPD